MTNEVSVNNHSHWARSAPNPTTANQIPETIINDFFRGMPIKRDSPIPANIKLHSSKISTLPKRNPMTLLDEKLEKIKVKSLENSPGRPPAKM